MNISELRKLLQGVSPKANISVQISGESAESEIVDCEIIGAVHRNAVDTKRQATPSVVITVKKENV